MKFIKPNSSLAFIISVLLSSMTGCGGESGAEQSSGSVRDNQPEPEPLS